MRVTGRTGKFFGQLPGTTKRTFLALTPDADALIFSSANEFWVDAPLKRPRIRPDGVISDLEISPTVTNNQASIAALTCWLAGAEVSVSAGNLLASRPTTPGNVRITALTVNSSGALAAVAGTEGTAGGARGAAGGPPYIPVGSIQLAEVTLTSTTNAPLNQVEIDTGQAERGDVPGFTIDFLTGKVTMNFALPMIHTGDDPRGVYAEYHFATIVQLGEFKQASFNFSYTRVDTMAAGDQFTDPLENFASFSGSAEFYYDDPFFVDHILADSSSRGSYFLEWQHHDAATFKLRGRVSFDLDLESPIDGAAMQTLSFTGKGRPVKVSIT